MKLISLQTVEPGMKLARPVADASGCIFLDKGASLNFRSVTQLQQMGVDSVYIDEEIFLTTTTPDQTGPEVVMVARKILSVYRTGKLAEAQVIEDTVSSIIDELLADRAMVLGLHEIRATRDYTFSHCIAVCVFSLITGVALGYCREQLYGLGAGALLHDLGKALVPEKIINKPSKLTFEEFSEIKRHAIIGYEILSKSSNIDPLAAQIAWQHHERADGTGYPLGLAGPDIHELARIVAIADVYHALSTDRTYRKRWVPDEIFEYLTMGDYEKFDSDILDIFIRNIPIYPIGTYVYLSSGQTGVVVKNHKNVPTRPVVRIVAEATGAAAPGKREIDLVESFTLYITNAVTI